MSLGDKAIVCDLPRFSTDTFDEAFDFYSDADLDTALALTGRTFDAEICSSRDTVVLAMTVTVGSAPNTNRLTVAPTTGAWTDLQAGIKYRFALWETTGSKVKTIIVGDVPVADR